MNLDDPFDFAVLNGNSFNSIISPPDEAAIAHHTQVAISDEGDEGDEGEFLLNIQYLVPSPQYPVPSPQSLIFPLWTEATKIKVLSTRMTTDTTTDLHRAG